MCTGDEFCSFEDVIFIFKMYPEQSLTPKHHFLTHYGEAIRRSGPVSNYWCMRFEAKHKMAKLVASAACKLWCQFNKWCNVMI